MTDNFGQLLSSGLPIQKFRMASWVGTEYLQNFAS